MVLTITKCNTLDKCAEMPHKGEENMKVELHIQTIKSHPDSNNPKRKEHTAIVRAIDLWKADEISTDANPRDQKTGNAVYKGIMESLLSNDGLFRYKSQGITINCKSIELENDPTKPLFIVLTEDPDDQHGVINGGHTYRAILEACQDISENEDMDLEKELSNQTVLVRFFSGIDDRESIVSIAEGQNSSVSVTKEAFLNMNKDFDNLKKKLPPLWENEIQFKQNELKEDGKTPYPMDSRDLLGLIWATNSSKFPSNTVDKMLTRPYSSKSSLVRIFEKDQKDFTVTKDKLKNILFMRDYIYCTAEKIYNENGGRFGSLRIAESFKEESVATVYGKAPANTLSRGAFLPIISSLRVFEEKGHFDFDTMKKAWDDSGHELISQLNDIVSVRESITEVGKDVICWGNITHTWFEWIGKNK